jgi:hypothetical protein
MITFIVLSRTPARLACLENSLREGLGERLAWRLVPVDGTRYDLFTGYNRGASLAGGEVLAFVHDDVEFWGNPHSLRQPLERVADPATGFVGVVGTRLLGEDGDWSAVRGEIRGMFASAFPTVFGTHWHFGPPWLGGNPHPSRAGRFGRVVVLDGIFLLCHRRTFEALGGFDDRTYEGFHFYDIDITFRATRAGLNNYALPVPLFHPSTNELSPEWERNRRIFVSKFRDCLPCRLAPGAPREAAGRLPAS